MNKLNSITKNQFIEELLEIKNTPDDEFKNKMHIIIRKWDLLSDKKAPIAEEYVYNKYGFCRTKAVGYKCPNCNHTLSAGPAYKPSACSNCGQLLTFEGITFAEEEFLGYDNISSDSNLPNSMPRLYAPDFLESENKP